MLCFGLGAAFCRASRSACRRACSPRSVRPPSAYGRVIPGEPAVSPASARGHQAAFASLSRSLTYSAIAGAGINRERPCESLTAGGPNVARDCEMPQATALLAPFAYPRCRRRVPETKTPGDLAGPARVDGSP